MTGSGRIQNYNALTGTGFIRADEGGELLPFSLADMQTKGEAPWEMQPVRYQITSDDEGEPRAIRLERV